jgi:quercetin dioxygenase-like cupin family protein
VEDGDTNAIAAASRTEFEDSYALLKLLRTIFDEGDFHTSAISAPRMAGGKSQKHGHVNEAAFYILGGQGAEIHDGMRYEWAAGDAAIVHNNCVHQHFNRNPDRPARALVMKTSQCTLL